jgi:hypothetical protein
VQKRRWRRFGWAFVFLAATGEHRLAGDLDWVMEGCGGEGGGVCGLMWVDVGLRPSDPV